MPRVCVELEVEDEALAEQLADATRGITDADERRIAASRVLRKSLAAGPTGAYDASNESVDAEAASKQPLTWGDVIVLSRTAAKREMQVDQAMSRLSALEVAVTSTPYQDLDAERHERRLLEAELHELQRRLEDVEAFKRDVLGTVRDLKRQIADIAEAALNDDADE